MLRNNIKLPLIIRGKYLVMSQSSKEGSGVRHIFATDTFHHSSLLISMDILNRITYPAIHSRIGKPGIFQQTAVGKCI